ncbi:hypothetical protein [Variovorax paradoxus]|uniref:hypothetical protein n=1 Tax=Variovorax paradoxus TaxID=34073 RepID=UPI0005A4F8FB|nr:hypothetical protein [Variovorax paradoxus]
MPLQSTEIVVGNVAYFDHQLLIADQFIDCGDMEIDRPGPYVCVQTKGLNSVWCGITTAHRRERLFIEVGWRVDGSPGWQQKSQFLHDGLATFFGPNSSFIACAAAERPFAPYTRPRISEAGIAAILAEIDAQGGPLL